MKRKSTFLRVFALMALLLPWTLQAQNAKVSEYDYTVNTTTYSSIVSNGGTAWTAEQMGQGYVDVSMPFALQFGETQIASGSTLRVYPDGSAAFTSLTDSRIAPLRYSSGYTVGATSIYTKSSSSVVTVEWRKVVSGTNSYSFQLKIYSTGDIEFCYGPMTLNTSISVFVGLMSSTSDIYRVGGAPTTSSWTDITRYTTGATTTRTLSSTYHPEYDATTGQGLVYTFTQPACVKLNTLTATALSSSSIKLEWTYNNAGVKYEIKYSTNADFNPDEEGTAIMETTGSALERTITGLTPNTTYYFAVRKYCNASTASGWMMASATTDCAPYTAADLPIFEDFDSYTASSTATIARCWTKTYGYNGSHTSYPYPSTTYKHSGSNSLYFYSSSTASYRSWVAIPYSGAMNNIAVNFWIYKTSANYGNIQVGVMSDPDDFSTFELIENAGINGSDYNTSTWYNQEVYFDNYTGNAGYIVLLAPSGATNYAYVDDITISTLPACRRLSGLQVTPSGLVTWNAISGATFEVKYATADFDPATEGTATTVSTNSFQIPSPAGSTTYYVYVRNVCNDYWKKATFTTPLTIPFSEDFSASTFPPSGWQRLTGLLSDAYSGTNPTSTTSGWTRYTNNYGLEAPHAKLNIYGTTYKYWLVTPNIYISGNAELTFDMALTKYGNANAITPGSQSDDKFAVLVSTDGGATWTQSNTLALWDNAGSSYVYDNIPNTGTTVVLPLTAYTGQSIMIAFYGESTVSGGDNDLHIDNISVDIHRSCAKPSDLAATNITANGATVTWTENSETAATQWKVKWANHTFTSDDTDVDSAIVNGTAQKVLAGLTPGTTYYFMVQALCDVTNGDISAWSTMSNFTTAFGVPFSEDFTTTTFPPTGWSRLTGLVNNAFSGTNPTSYSGGWARATTSYGLSTQPFARGNIYGTGWRHWLVTPNISIDVNAALSFDIALTGYSSSGNSAAQTTGTDDRFVVLVSTDNGATWSSSNVLREWNNSGSSYVYNDISRYGEHVIIPLTAYQGQSVMIAFYGESQTSNADNYFYIDNVSIDQIVSCYPVTNIAVSNITGTSVDLSWNDNNTNPDSWTVIYGAPGFDPATAGTSVTTTTNPFTLTGLTPQTSYDVYVRANCVTGSDVSALSSVYNFATTCTNPCYDSIYMTDDYGDGWEGHTIDLYVNGALKAQYTLSSGSEGSALIQMCPGDQIQLKWSQNGGTMYGENNFEIYNHDNELIYSCVGEAGLSSGITLWSGRACFTPNCHIPNQLEATSVTYTTATLDWTETTTPAPTQWVLAYMSENDPSATYVAINTKPYTLTGLTANTNYAFAVRAVCEPGVDSSDWSTTAYFYTGYCIPTPSSVDNSGMTNIAFGDNLVVNTDTTLGLTYGDFTNLIGDAGQGTNAEVVINYGTGYTYGTHIWVDWNNDLDFNDAGELVYTGLSESTNPTTLAATFAIPANTALGDYRMRIGGSDNDDGPDACYTGSWACLFDFTLRVTPAPTCYKPTALTASNIYGKQVTLSWNENTPTAATQWQLCYTANGETTYKICNTNNNYTLTGLEPETDYTNVMVRAICGAGDSSNWSTPISFTTMPACYRPTALTASATINSATLSWTENTLPTAATRWEVAYGAVGFDPDNEDEATYVETTNNTAFVVNGLHHSRSYQFYVRALCTETEYSAWSNVATAATLCGAWSYADMPLFEDFDGVTGTTTSTTTVLPNNCWSKINNGSSYYGRPQVYSGSSYAASGTNSMYFYVGTADSYADNYAILPEMGFNVDTINISLSARFGSASSVITIGVMTDPTDVSTFVPVTTIHAPSTGYSTHTMYEASLEEYTGTGRYVAIAALKGSATNYFYIDDLTMKLREKVNSLPTTGATLAICNEVVIPDTVNGNYANSINNATYVINPATPGQVVHLTGSYDLENGYDFIDVYEGKGNNRTLVGTYTGKGNVDFVTTSSDWVNKGSITLVFRTDVDNAFDYTGFHLLASCECPQPVADTVYPSVVANGTYTWINGQTYTNQSTTENAASDSLTVFYAQPNVAGCDSVYYVLDLVVHPSYTLNYSAEICERDVYDFYGQQFTSTGNYTVTLQSQYGADSVGVLALQMHEAPTAGIYYNNRKVNVVNAFCDGAEMALLARSNNTAATFMWDDQSTSDNRVVNPHASNLYTVYSTDPVTGCTSTIDTLVVTTTPVPALSISGNAEICYGQSATLTLADANNVPATYRWSNNATTTSITVSPTTTTTYTVTATTDTSSCTATAEFTVTVNPLPVVTATASVSEICSDSLVTLTATEVIGYNYSWNTGATTAVATTAATVSGAYTVTVTDQKGCVNEFNTANVTVHPSYELNDTMSACIGMLPYTWKNMVLPNAGSYDQNFTIGYGCDSLVHLTFIVEDTAVYNSNRELCEGTVFTFGTGIYAQSYTATNTTVVTYLDTTSGECPARYNLNLTVNHPKTNSFDRVVCDSTRWNGVFYDATGAYNQTLATTKGCDSVVTMNLTVNMHSFAERNETTCDSYTWNNETYTTVGDYTQEFPRADVNGCDSTETLHLTEVRHSTTGVDEILWCNTRSYTWIDGITYNLSETSGNISYLLPNTTNVAGCDTTAILHLVLNPVTDTLNWVAVTTCDEYLIDTVACDNTIGTKIIRTSGDYQMRTRNVATGRDQWTRLHMTVNNSTYHTNVVTACVPYTWTVVVGQDTLGNDINYEVGTFNPVGNDTVISFEMPEQFSNGCNRIEILRLTAKHPVSETEYASVCKMGTGNSFTAHNGQIFNGNDYELGENTIHLITSTIAANGCPFDSTLVLTVNEAKTREYDVELCESMFTYDATQGLYTYNYTDAVNGDNIVVSYDGTYPNTDTNGVNYNTYTTAINNLGYKGCDSISNYVFSIIPTKRDTTTAVACMTYTWETNGREYTQAGTTFDSVDIAGEGFNSCIRRAYLNLTINTNDTAIKVINVCSSYEGPDGNTYRVTKTFETVVPGAAANGCDSIYLTTYNVLQHQMTDVYVTASGSYRWVNGTTYTEDVDGVYYEAVNMGGCDSILVLHLTMVEPIVICDNELPYETRFGFTLDTGAVSGVYDNVEGANEMHITYTINPTFTESFSVTACDSYTWSDSLSRTDTYTQSGMYTRTFTASNGCESVTTLNLTINNSYATSFDTAACDKLVWEGTTYTATGTGVHTYTAANNCDSVVTMNLTINNNSNTGYTAAACEKYVWYVGTDSIGEYTASGNYVRNYNAVNGCPSVDTLHLTINHSIVVNDSLVDNGGSYVFNGVFFQAPVDTHLVVNSVSVVTGCDSTYNFHLVLPLVQSIIYDTITACGTYEWRDGKTYAWIPVSERQQVGMALYKNITDNKYVYSYPTDTVFMTNGAIDRVYVLYLNVLEANYRDSSITLPLSFGTYTIAGIDNAHSYVIDFTSYRDSRTETTIDTLLALGSTYYCDDYVTFHITLVDNYDTVYNTICDNVTSYDWNAETYTVGVPGHTYEFIQTENAGTMNELVHYNIVRQLAVNSTTIVDTVCNTYTWDGTTYTVSGTDTKHYTTGLGCDSVVTLNLVVKNSTYNTESAVACDKYTWVNNGTTNNYTATGVYYNNYNNAAGCPSADTLHLTINNSVATNLTDAACNSYDWHGHTYTASQVIVDTLTAANTCDSIVTMTLTINLPTSRLDSITACDTYTWNETEYTVGGMYFHNYNTAAGCASIDTLVLTMNQSTHNVEVDTACDSYLWNGQTYTATGAYRYDYNNVAGCASFDSLYLVINVNPGRIDTIVNCGDYVWAVNGRTYTTSGSYTVNANDANGCSGSYTLNLTVNNNTTYDTTIYISDGSYRYNGVMYVAPFDTTFVEHSTNAVGCDSATNIHLHVGTAYFTTQSVISCSEYTWINGKTYTWLSDAERAANNNALYYNATDQTYVLYNPTYTVQQDNDYDSIYMLTLTLTQSTTSHDVVNLPISLGSVTYGDSTFHFEALSNKDFVNTSVTREVHIYNPHYCDSIVVLEINLVNNFSAVATDDICVTTNSYSWRGHTISTATNDYDNAHTYYVYDTVGTGNNTVVEYMTLTQHPIVYATERRTACDIYTWNGMTFTESTSRATFDTVDRFGCDSIVTLVLTINHNTGHKTTVASCESYIWAGASGDTLLESGTYYYDYYTPAPANCPSQDTLVLTINHNSSEEFTADACDSYTWTAEEGGDGRVLTVAGDYTYNYNTPENCPSTNTLHLTLRTNSNQTITKTVCDTYTWTENGNGETYTTSGVYTYDYEAANGCPSTNTLNLTVNHNNGHKEVVADACGSYTWHGVTYTASDSVTYDYADANNCASVDTLVLTVNYATHNVYTEIACNTYDWVNNGATNTYTTSGVYYHDYTNAAGCASADTLHLTIGNGRAFGTEHVTNCGPYTWIINDETVDVLTESMETSTTVINPATGCDSVVFLYLTVYEQPVVNEAATICDNELPYTWRGVVFTEAGSDSIHRAYTAQCDSVYNFTLTVNPTAVTNLTDQICLGNGYTANGFNIAASEMPTAGVYTFVDHRTTDANCEHTYNLTLTVGDVINVPVAATACDSYTWTPNDGISYTFTESGTYNSAEYANAQGCTSVDVLTLTINNNSSRGYTETVCDGYMWNGTQYTESGEYTYNYTDGNNCASTDTLHLTVNNSVIRNIPMTVCDSYTWDEGDGQTYTASGVYGYNYTTTDGCNGTDYLVLTVNHNSSTAYTAVACDDYTWNANNTTYTVSGDYTYSYTDANNCASVDTLHLTVNYKSNTEYDATACDSYTWNGQTYTQSGDYNYDYVNIKGCPSTDVLHLTVNYNSNTGETQTACNSYTWNGTTYTQSGTYYRHYTTDEGCASVDTLFLTINTTVNTVVAETACESYTWNNGITYTTSGTYYDTILDLNGCDAIVTLNLTVNHNTNSAETATACDSYTWNGQTYTTSGNYTYNYNAANGCASVDTLHLTVNNGVTGTATAEACNYYIWNGTAYNQSGTYTQTLNAANGCDSVVTLTLTINTMVTNTVTASACGSYVWNGAVYTTSGNYTQNFSSAAGCDSVVTLALTINPAVTSNITATACNNYNWNGTNYTTSGIYSHTYTAANGCDSIVNLMLTVNHTVNNTVNATACDSYTWNNQTYTTSGFYTMTFAGAASNGCDSVAHLSLTINNSAATTLNASACNSYTWNGATYTTAGSYTQNLRTVNNCDSIVTLNLTLNQAVTNTVNQTACDIYTWNGTTYTTSGVYTHTYSSAAGCDSVVTLNLTIAPTITVTMPVTACDSYTMDTVTYTTSGTFTRYYLAAGGCDSIVTYNLTINNSNTGVETTTACDSYTWIDGQTYTASTNVPTWTLTNAAGCDSVVTLNLSVVYHTTGVDVEAACDSYTWMNGQTYTVSTNTPTYTLTGINGCDSVVTLNLTVNYSGADTMDVAICDGFEWEGTTYNESGVYTYQTTTVAGCDSIITIYLTVNHSVETYDTLTVDKSELPYLYGERYLTEAGDYEIAFTTVTGCDSTVYLHFVVEGVGIDVTSALEELKVYPNPTHGRVTLTAENVLKVEVLDIVGRLVATFENTNTFDLSNLNEGAYTLRITLPEGVTIRKVVKK